MLFAKCGSSGDMEVVSEVGAYDMGLTRKPFGCDVGLGVLSKPQKAIL